MTLMCAFNKKIAEELDKRIASPEGFKHAGSEQQEQIWWACEHGPADENIVIIARAGTGKTTTLVEGVRRAPESKTGATAKTLHAVGYEVVRRYWEDIRVNKDDRRQLNRADALAEQVCGPRTPDAIKRLVSKLHSKGREITPHARTLGQLTGLMEQFELEPDEQWEGTEFNAEFVEERALAAMELAATVKPVATGIDFSDMIFLPVRNRWLTKTYDLVVVDEAQDMTVAQLEIAQGICRGRIIVIGDDRQAVYGFRGADSGSLGRLQGELNARQFSLTTTYRCGKAIVALAQTLVPDFVAGPGNPEGEVTSLAEVDLTKTAGPGCFILSRLNAPLVSTAMALLRAGKRTRVAGRDIGAGLKTLIRKLNGKSIPDFLKRLASWEDQQVNRMIKAKREDRIEAIHDQADMLMSLAQDASSVTELNNRIDALFTDDGLGAAGLITCSSIHRSKGLEANTVYILESTLRDSTQEELNIKYVAITRAKTSLVFVR